MLTKIGGGHRCVYSLLVFVTTVFISLTHTVPCRKKNQNGVKSQNDRCVCVCVCRVSPYISYDSIIYIDSILMFFLLFSVPWYMILTNK